jgi:hypothetical protein
MTDILAQIGTKLGAEVKYLQTQIDAGGGGGGGSNPTDDYTESTFANGVLTAMTTWTDNTKSVLVSGKAFTYTNGLLTQVVESDENNTTTLTKTITYDSNGNLESITKDYA